MVESPDSLRSKQYARIIDCVCEGPIVGLVDGEKSVYLNDTPLKNLDGSFNFTGVSIISRKGTQGQSYIQSFPSVESEQTVGVVVLKDTPVVRQISDSSLNYVRVSLAFPRLVFQDTTTGDIRGTSVEYQIELQSDGDVYKAQYILSDKASDATITSDIATTKAGTVSLFGQAIWARPQICVDGTGAVVTCTGSDGETYQNINIVYDIEYKTASSGTWLQAERVTLSGKADGSYTSGLNNLLQAPSVPDGTSFSIGELGADVYNVRLTKISGSGSVGLDYVKSYAPSTVGLISGKTTTQYIRDHTIKLVGDAPWNIRVSRITEDSTETNLANEFSWASYTEIVDSKLAYPNSALMAIQIDSEQFDSIPARSYDLKLLKVKVPSNYNPITREYSGLWNGTFVTAWTDNPAWCFYDLITNNRYGLGKFIDASLVDKATLYTVGQYCDELVPDGLGGTEPRFTCNLYLQTREEAFKVISNMASIFRAMVYWSNNLITMVQDAPEDVWTQFTNADVIDGLFNYEGSASKTRHTVALVAWNDPENDYKQTVEYVEDTEAVSLNGIIETETVAMGCTSRGQANRLGKWLLFTEKNETELITFKTGLKGTQITPGKIIRTSDQTRAGVRHGGRIVSSTASTVTLDAPLTIGVGTYTISFILPDGSLVDKTITNGEGTYTTVNVSPSFTTQPIDYSIWVATSDDVNPETWRVVSISEDDKNVYTVSAIEHNPSKFDAVEDGLALEVKSTSILNANYQPPATGITVEESLYIIGLDTIGIKALISWEGSAARYTMSYRYEGGIEGVPVVENFITLPNIRDTSVEVLDLYEGDYTFSITAYNALGVDSEVVTSQVTILGKLAPPTDVSGFSAVIGPDGIYLSWNKNTDLDVRQYEVRLNGTSWDDAEIVGAPIDNSFFHAPSSGENKYRIKALDTTGNYSLNDSTSTIYITSPSTPEVSSEVIDNNVLLRWTDARTTMPVEKYEVRKGATWETSLLIGFIDGRFSTVFETVSGTYLYWIRGIDVLGNAGLPGYVTSTVSQPPDFKLEYDQYADLAAFNPPYKTNSYYDGSGLVFNINTTETWSEHFTNNSWTTIQDQIDAGYPLYLQPTLLSGSVYDEYDLGVVIGGTTIQLVYDQTNVSGTVTIYPTISVKLNSGDAWTDYAGVTSVFTSNFRYIKVTLDFSSATDTDLAYLTYIRTLVSIKLRSDSGSVACLSTDSGGTQVNFNLTFLDVDSITVTANSTTPVIAIFDFVDAPNPTGFKILLYNTSGTRVSGTASWTARGATL